MFYPTGTHISPVPSPPTHRRCLGLYTATEATDITRRVYPFFRGTCRGHAGRKAHGQKREEGAHGGIETYVSERLPSCPARCSRIVLPHSRTFSFVTRSAVCCVLLLPSCFFHVCFSSMEQARDDLAHELASGTPNYAQAVAGALRYCPLIAHVLRSLEKAVRRLSFASHPSSRPSYTCTRVW